LGPREQRRGGTREAEVGIASALRLEWLEELFPDRLRRERSARFDEERGRAVGVTTLWYRDLLLREDCHAPLGRDEAAATLAVALRPRATEFFRRDAAAAQWLARLD